MFARSGHPPRRSTSCRFPSCLTMMATRLPSADTAGGSNTAPLTPFQTSDACSSWTRHNHRPIHWRTNKTTPLRQSAGPARAPSGAAVRLQVTIVRLAIEQRHAPQAGGGVGDGGDHATAVATGRYRRELPGPRAHRVEMLAPDIERPQPRPRPVLRARHVQQRPRVERGEEIHRVPPRSVAQPTRLKVECATLVHRVELAPIRRRSRSTDRPVTRPGCGCGVPCARGFDGRPRPMPSATNRGSPSSFLKYARRAPSGDQAGAVAPLSRNACGAPPIKGMIICAIDGPVSD